jgi:cell division protein FtsB
MSQPRDINLDGIRLRKAQQDREQSQDLDDLVTAITNLAKENAALKARVEELESNHKD